MRRTTCFTCAIMAGILLLTSRVSAQEPSYRLREIFAPQTSEFTERHPGVTNSFDLSPDGKKLAVEFGTQEPDKTIGAWVAVWDVDTERLIAATQVDQKIPNLMWYRHEVRFSPDGRVLLVLTGPSVVALSSSELKILYTLEDRVLPENAQKEMLIEGFSVAVNRLAVLKQYDHNSGHAPSLEVEIANLESGNVIADWIKPGLSHSIALSSDASLLALTMNPGPWGVRNIPLGADNIFVVKTDSGDVVRAFNSGSAAGNAEFVGGSTALITMPIYSDFEPGDKATLWNVKTGHFNQTVGYPKYGLRGGMSTSANGELLAVAAFWLNPADVRLDRDNPRGGARLLLWTLPKGKLIYESEKLGQEYDLGRLPMSLSWGFMTPPVLVRMSASGDRLAFGGQLISVNSVEKDSAQK